MRLRVSDLILLNVYSKRSLNLNVILIVWFTEFMLVGDYNIFAGIIREIVSLALR